jgi:hypothetical protein
MSYYVNEEEDKKAVDTILYCKSESISELEQTFKRKNIPFRERYYYLFLGVKLKESKKADKKNKLSLTLNSSSSWWEKYLAYERVIKCKLREELYPDLQELTLMEITFIRDIKELHIPFIKKGYEYYEMIEKYNIELALIDMDDPNYEYDNIDGPCENDILKELENIEKKYGVKLTVSENKNYNFNPRYCAACQQTPCMCSDPF